MNTFHTTTIGLHLDVGVADDAIWQRRWRRLAAQSARWYATPSGAVGHRFTAILSAEWRGVFGRSWKSERPLVFAHVSLTNTMAVRGGKDICARITRRMNLWERGLHAGLVGGAEAEGTDSEGRAAIGGEYEYEAVAQSYHDAVLSVKLIHTVRWATDSEGGGCLLPDDQCIKTGRQVAEVLREKHPYMHVPPVENPACAAFKEYGEVPETVPLNFTEDDVTWVASKLSRASGMLGAEDIEMINWLLCFRCASEELRVLVARLADWMANSEEGARREFAAEGLVLNFVSGSRYLGAYLGPQEELDVWVKT